MKKLPLFLFVLFYLMACTTPQVKMVGQEASPVPENPELQSTPQALSQSQAPPWPAEIDAPVTGDPSIISICMLDELYGWGITETQIIRTNDGGVTWYDVTPQGLETAGYGIFSEFYDIQHAWIQVPDAEHDPVRGKMYHTRDGGITWTSAITPFSSGDIAFVDPGHGWVMADLGAGAGSMAVSIFQTHDGGATWTRTYTNDPNLEGAGDTLPSGGLKEALTPLDMQTAWIRGVIYSPGSVYLYRTDDGGQTWFRINLELPAPAQLNELAVDGIQFVSEKRGFLAIRVISDEMRTIIFATEDGGNTWSPSPAELPGAGRLDILSDRELVYFIDDKFYVTKDAAQSWMILTPDMAFGESLTQMSFVNAKTGWIITMDPASHRALYKTIDGGTSWLPIIP